MAGTRMLLTMVVNNSSPVNYFVCHQLFSIKRRWMIRTIESDFACQYSVVVSVREEQNIGLINVINGT